MLWKNHLSKGQRLNQPKERNLVDLHLHSVYSDGTQEIEEIIDISEKLNMKAIALADHDTIDGVKVAFDTIKRKCYELELVPATELSTWMQEIDMHILAYYFDDQDNQFRGFLDYYKQKREERGIKIVERLQDLGVCLDSNLVVEIANGGSIGRPHVARAMVHSGIVRSIHEAFAKYIGYHRPAYIKKEKMTPEQAIKAVHDAGGFAVLAHAGNYLTDDLLNQLIDMGLDGLEVYHPLHNNKMTYQMLKKAKEKKLLITGGSDSHGNAKSDTYIGAVPVPVIYYEQLRDKKYGS